MTARRPAPGVAPYLVVAAFWAVTHLGLAIAGTTPVLDGRILDTDGYMWLARVERLWATGAWFDDVMPRANAPAGDALNWTRPLDVAISLLALPFRPVADLRDALFIGGALVSPLFQLVTVLALAWAARPLIDVASRPMVALVAIANFGLFGYSLAGRPDHHALVAALLALLIGGAMRLALTPAARGGVLAFALAGAGGLWATPEFLIPLAVAMAAALAAWLVAPAAPASAAWRRGWSAMALAAAVAIVLERGPRGLLLREPDKISLTQLAVLAVCAALWWIAERLSPWPPGRRLAGIAIAAAALAGLAALLVPGIWRGPAADIDPRVMAIFLSTTTEMRSLLTPDLDSLGDQLRFNALGVVAAAAAGLWAWRARGTPAGAAWAVLAALSAGYVVFTSIHVRFAMFGGIAAAVPLAELLRRLRERLAGGLGALLLRTAAMAAIIIGPAMLGSVVEQLGGGKVARAVEALDRDCDLRAVVPALTDGARLGARPDIVIAHLDFGSELIWRTPHGVLGTPFHRNRDGILDGRAFFDARDDGTAQAIAARRGAGLVLFCPNLAHENPPGSLGARLLAGAAPPWLERVPVAGTALALFRIVAAR
ncbi:MAG: hypothetical protein JNK67_27600 [Alphaproteobacteria bacterium]|nr:hypothetical protein [Alphaproteobacteria bacterium]